MEIVVEHIGGPRRGEVDRFPAGRIIVGQANSAQVYIGDPSIAPMHLEITPTEGGLIVTDLGSTTGSRVFDQPITEPTPVPSGTLIHLGHGVAIRVSLEGMPASAPLPPPTPPGAGQTLVASSAALQGAPTPAAQPAYGAPAPYGAVAPTAPPPPPAAGAAPVMPPGASPAPAVGPVTPPPPAPAPNPTPPPSPADALEPATDHSNSSNENFGSFIVLLVLGALLILGLFGFFLLLALG